MTKVKKQVLSLEKRLKQALVPESEQPYLVPDNWVWTKLDGLVSDIKNGTTIKQGKNENNYPVTRIESIQNNTIDFNRLGYIEAVDKIKDTDWYLSGDIALSHINSAEHVGKTALIQESFLPLLHGMNLLCLRFLPAIIPELFQYFSRSYQYKLQILSRINMAVNQVSINQKQLRSIQFPLPPLAEQQRIVTQIESLFQKLDSARDLVQNALDSFETRKAAILHKAFTGNLTSSWRKKNSVEIDAWEPKTINEVCTSLQYGTSKKSQKTGEVVVIRMGNLQNGEIVWDDLAYSNENDDIEKYLLQPGDILFNRTNSPDLVGKTSIYRGDMPAIFAGYLIRLNYKKEIIDGDFLNYLLNSIDAKEYCNKVKTDGVNQSNINAKKIGAYSFNRPSLTEQQEIVRILDSLLENEQKAKDLCDILDRIDLMKKAILARAFRGELGTNDPNEESALELLKDVLAKAKNK